MNLRYDGNFVDFCPYYWAEKEMVKNKTLNNRDLDGFLEFFKKNNPRCDAECQIDCNYCSEFLYKALEKNVAKEGTKDG